MSIDIPGHSLLDIGQVVATTLENEWDATNTDGVVPTVYYAADVKRMRYRQQDAILVTGLQEFHQPTSLQYEWEDIMYSLTIQTTTGGSRDHGVKVKDEVYRILMNNRVNSFSATYKPKSGSIWLIVKRVTDNIYKQRLFYSFSHDIQVRWRYRAVRT